MSARDHRARRNQWGLGCARVCIDQNVWTAPSSGAPLLIPAAHRNMFRWPPRWIRFSYRKYLRELIESDGMTAKIPKIKRAYNLSITIQVRVYDEESSEFDRVRRRWPLRPILFWQGFGQEDCSWCGKIQNSWFRKPEFVYTYLINGIDCLMTRCYPRFSRCTSAIVTNLYIVRVSSQHDLASFFDSNIYCSSYWGESVYYYGRTQSCIYTIIIRVWFD